HPHPHGTLSAGVISAMLESQGNRYYDIYDYQVLNEHLRTSLAAVVAAFDDIIAQGDIQLVALSIGFVPRACDNINWEDPASPLYAVLERARAAGIVVITSAGNDSNDLLVNPQYPAAYSRLQNVISVGALGCEDESPAVFSNYGDKVVDLFTTGAFVRTLYAGCEYQITGTSFATSIVAGKAALHFAMERDPSFVLCKLRSETKQTNPAYSIHGIIDVTAGERSCTSSVTSPGSSVIAGIRGRAANGTGLSTTISPNPFKDLVTVTLEEPDQLTTLTVFDAQGRQISTQRVTQSQVELDLRTLVPGAYWLRIQDENGSETRTIVKQ
ncbi:MAG: S8 family peptidase, partial [Bacteroidota bacterium]